MPKQSFGQDINEIDRYNMNNIELISQHNSWISVNPVLGCPAGCSYCYLKSMKMDAKIPVIRESNPKIVYQRLLSFRYFNKNIFSVPIKNWQPPILIGDYTDICATQKNQEYLISLLSIHKQILPNVPICIPTKAPLNYRFLEILNNLDLIIIFLISISFLPQDFEKGVCSSKARLKNIKLIAKFSNLKAIHWWRPLTSINAPNAKVIEQQMDLVQNADSIASVIIGLLYSPKLSKSFKDTLNPFYSYFTNFSHLSNYAIFEEWIRDEILSLAAKKNYPVFSGTDCCISYILGRFCYNAKFRRYHLERSCFNSNCPTTQKKICRHYVENYQKPSLGLIKELAVFLGLSSKDIVYSPELDVILVNREMRQDLQNFVTQAIQFPVLAEKVIPTLEFSATWRSISIANFYYKE